MSRDVRSVWYVPSVHNNNHGLLQGPIRKPWEREGLEGSGWGEAYVAGRRAMSGAMAEADIVKVTISLRYWICDVACGEKN